ncbi:hypothetical protein J4558_06055 [Leptolyngbya sp. 15MV]|nr:hypothetical protein J4558_06055 [Leptolyngbya sp. 15MV]
MFSSLRRRFGRRFACKPGASDARNTGLPATEADRRIVLRALGDARHKGQRVTLREVHRLARLPQPVALRCVRHLEQAGTVEIDAVEHDPLSSEIRLAK